MRLFKSVPSPTPAGRQRLKCWSFWGVTCLQADEVALVELEQLPHDGVSVGKPSQRLPTLSNSQYTYCMLQLLCCWCFFPPGRGWGVRVCGISFRNRILLHVLLFFFTGGPCYTRTDASSVLGFILHQRSSGRIYSWVVFLHLRIQPLQCRILTLCLLGHTQPQ